ncbi:MAG: DUF4258 domain-containing protein [Thermodesulfobacteriota bacterium]|nr:DUF4258 domain-containing protein [Thermodesulfobacteriota bacterium]
MADILTSIKKSAAKNILFLPHAVRQMTNSERMISTKDIRNVINKGEVIEDYPQDPRGHSCLLCYSGDRPIHVVCSPKEDYLAVITAYIPRDSEWKNNYKVRKKS